ncbi:UNVERIFIED_CONTAM: hypothetical protein GTU68_014028, partial [Idotea baltica]|nr:hypothetical protein [Idotea baltica]
FQDEVLSLLQGLLKCNYTDKTDYLNFAYGNHEMFVRNSRLWQMCSTMPRFKCYVSENIGKLCSLFPIQVMKLVRVRLSVLAPLMEDKSVKIIWLTRDPRAVINSRTSSVSWCTSKVCKEPKYLCRDLFEDFNTYLKLKNKYPEQIMILRYEDLAKDPYTKSKNTLAFLNLQMDPSVVDYLNKHINSDFEAPWSTIHNPQRQAKKWMKSLPWNSIVYTQYYCRTVMKNIGYRPFENEIDLAAGNAVQILNIQ